MIRLYLNCVNINKCTIRSLTELSMFKTSVSFFRIQNPQTKSTTSA